ncbi:hypothetical protein F5Y06DRAFT_307765 [Hypoxylon sp. FL0890]|nr:hypothetical protein F5Y06DRAFT_307765 [Hypoxylon sp. FL0890]
MDSDRPIKADTSASEAPFVESEPSDNTARFSSIPRAESSQSHSFQDPATAQSGFHSTPLPPARQVGTEATAFPDVTIKGDAETLSDQQHDLHQRDERDGKDTGNLERLATKSVPEALESAVAIGVNLLAQLEAALGTFIKADVDAWFQSIDELKLLARSTGTVVAIVKTDDISIKEAIDSLGLEEELSESWNRAKELENSKQLSESLLAKYKEQKAALDEEFYEVDLSCDLWGELLEDIYAGKTVYPPGNYFKKRKRPGKPFMSRKSRSRSSHKSEVDDDSGDKENSQSDQDDQPVSEGEAEEKLGLLEYEWKRIKEQKRTVKTQIASVRKQIEETDVERREILAKIKARCIQKRNDYSRGAIKQDFAMGIRELDQENTEEGDDFQSQGFMIPEDTEIPQLQQHAKKLTEAERASNCRRFLNELTQLTNSMKLWAANNGTQSTLTEVGKQGAEMHLHKLLNDLANVCNNVSTLPARDI